ncbi:MAG: putative rane protein YeaQ/YmgE, transglycosylase-associated protein family [Pseudobdellovibrio sp.]|jgi:uncharacterized membrane protein YeaQ/YmgE (transglycosylase-associated protein family)|nr:putative rane protein YeaQ/YmgE, transglycosylase-associated protein family [Pseudobdellovibrio sp.]
MLHVILFLMVGLTAGWLATNFVEGKGYGGLGDIVIGTVGAFIGSFIFDLLGFTFKGFWGAVFVAVVGAVVFLYIVNFFTGNSTDNSANSEEDRTLSS